MKSIADSARENSRNTTSHRVEAEGSSLPYLAPLDGIRAIAILGVLVFHVWPSAMKGGFSGVDVFFVLSGFLITSIILHDIRKGGFSTREFYLRRIQRLLPNVIVMVAAVLMFWMLLLPPGSAVQPAQHGLWALVNFSNIYIWKKLGGYWGNAAEWAPLTHTWSLGVEEQFYLLFPGCLLLLARFSPGRVRTWLTAATLLSLGLCVYGTYARRDGTFYLLPTRVWELLIGSIFAAHRIPARLSERIRTLSLGRSTREAVGWIGLSVVAIGFFAMGDGSNFPGFIALVPTVGTLLVLCSVTEGGSSLSRTLSMPALVQIGKYSYSIYLWHWPLIILGKLLSDLYVFPLYIGAVAGGIAGVFLGWIAYIAVEQPLRARGPGRTTRFMIIAVGFAAVAVSCRFISAHRPTVDPLHLFDPITFSGKLYDAGRPSATDVGTLAASVRYSDVSFPSEPTRPNDVWRSGGIIHAYGGGTPKIVVMGSSHALMYSKLIDHICEDRRISVSFFGVDSGTPAFFETEPSPNFPTIADAHEFDKARRKWIKSWHPDIIFIIDRWDVRVPNGIDDFKNRLQSFLTEVSPYSGKVIFVAQVPVIKDGQYYNLRSLVSWHMEKDHQLPNLVVDSAEDNRKMTVVVSEALTTAFPNFRVLRADERFYKEDGTVIYANGRSFLYTNGDHLTDDGAEFVGDLFENALRVPKSAVAIH
jgi:peptidoglycan/LPS O-acetylase OafA/YrhL